jgi:hypothetical protein
MGLLDLIKRRAGSVDAMRKMLISLRAEDPHDRVRQLELTRSELLLAGSDRDLDAVDEEIRRASRNIERVERAIADLEARIVETEGIEQEVARREKYEAAMKAAAQAAAALRQYPTFAQRIVGLLASVAEAEIAINAANADLPAGAVALPSAEFQVRGLAGEPRQEVGRKIVRSAWFYTGADESELEPSDTVVSQDGRTGYIETRLGGRKQVETRPVERVDYIEGRPPYIPEPLHLELRLPGLLPGEPAIWAGLGNSAVFFHGRMGADAVAVVEHASRQSARSRPAPKDPRQSPSTLSLVNVLPSQAGKLLEAGL